MGGRWAVALLGVATAIPAAAVSAVLLTGGSDAAVLQLTAPSGTLGGLPHRSAATVPPAEPAGSSTSAAVVPVPLVAGPPRTATAAARSNLRTLAPGARVGTPDGRLTFVAPQGWLYGLCPQGGDACVEVAPVGLGAGDAIDVLVTAGAAGDTTGTDQPTGGPTVAGRPAQVLDLPSNDSVLVYGTMPEAGSRFMVSCRYDAYESLLRKACDQVLGSLRIAA